MRSIAKTIILAATVAALAALLLAGGVTMQAQEYNSNNTKTPALTQYDY